MDIRVNSTNRIADSGIVKELERVVHNQTFDAEPMPEFSSGFF